MNSESYINVFKNIYVDLDAILDTRLGTLYHLDKNLYNFYKSDGKEKYKNRLIDEFEYIPNNVFKYYYKKRNLETLKHSGLTPLLPIMNLTINDMLYKRITADKNIKKLIIDVNYYPYTLTEDLKKYLTASILSKIDNKEFIHINMVSIPYEKLTVRDCENYGVIYMYDGVQWLNIRGLLKDTNINIPNTHLVIPYKFEKPVIFKSNKDIKKYFKDIEKMFEYYIKIDFNRLELFSFIK